MNKSHKPSFTVEEYKIKASILLKSLRGGEAQKTAKRLQKLPEFADLSITEILKQDIKRKHALQLIAIENGFHSWLELKIQVNFIKGGHLNLWFANYAEAKSHQQSHGGFILPYKKQFFICNADYIAQIGFDPNDSDWQKIQFDAAKPTDKNAWQRLYRQWMKVKGERHE